MNYYNDFDPKTCAWLRELIKAGHLPQVAAEFIKAFEGAIDDARN